MIIPATFLPPLSPEEVLSGRKNLCLNSRNGSVNADIWLLSTPEAKAPTKRTVLDLSSEYGYVTTRVVRLLRAIVHISR